MHVHRALLVKPVQVYRGKSGRPAGGREDMRVAVDYTGDHRAFLISSGFLLARLAIPRHRVVQPQIGPGEIRRVPPV